MDTKSIADRTTNDAKTIKRGDKSASEWLVSLGQNDAQDLFRDQFGSPHALVDGVPIPLDGSAHRWLRKLLWNTSGKTAKKEDLNGATETLAMLAGYGDERTLHIRAAQRNGAVYVWAGSHNVIEVDAGGWRRVAESPVLFREVPTLKPLPNPVSGGDLNRFGHYIRLRHERDKRLNIAWIVTAYLANIPRPINLGTGVQGAAKTTGQRVIKRTLDPAAPSDFKLRRKDFAQNLDNCYIPFFDNAGDIDRELSDDLCRATTGSGNSDRKLYSDNNSVVREYKRAMLINGINNPTERGDFMDRALPTEYERIPKSERRAESDLWAEFEQEHPMLLGAVLDALSGAIRLRVPLAQTPRLADWAQYASAVYEFMAEQGHAGWGRDQFAKDWNAVEDKQHEAALEGSPVAQAIRKLMQGKDTHEDTPAELHDELTTVADGMGLAGGKEWPKSSNWVWKKIREALPTLETFGIRAEKAFTGRGKDKRNVIRLSRTGGVGSGVGISSLPTDQKALRNGDGAGGAGGVGIFDKPSTHDLGQKFKEKRRRRRTVGGRKFCRNASPTDPTDPIGIGKPLFGVGSGTDASPTENASPGGSPKNHIDDPWLWDEKVDPETGKIVPRIFHPDVEIPRPEIPETPEPEFDPDKWTRDGTRELTVDLGSAMWLALDTQGSTVYPHAVELIREIREDWKGHDLPADAWGWSLLLEANGESYNIEAVERALEAA